MRRVKTLLSAVTGFKVEGVNAAGRKCSCRSSSSSSILSSVIHQLDLSSENKILSLAASSSAIFHRHSSSVTGNNNNNNNNAVSSHNCVTSGRPNYSSRNVVTSQKIVEVAYSRKMEEKKLLSKEERRDFSVVFPTLVKDIINNPELRDMPDTNRWMARVLQYNTPHGKLNRGLALALAYRYLTSELTEENVHLSYILGWCVEILQAFFLVADDIMDGSEMRRGQPCWYRVDDMGPTAFNDAILLEAAIYPLLKKYFKDKSYYVDLIELFHDATFKTAYGQSLDTRTGLKQQFDTYTPELYAAIVKYKTSYYSFYLPVSLAMSMAGIRDPEALNQAKGILLEMGHFFQVQDDYLDVYGDVEVTGKIGTDIADGKCSWVVVTALQAASPVQRQTILDNYGKNEVDKVEICKNLFTKMGIPELYQAYEEQTYNLINSRIDNVSTVLPKKLFRDMLEKIYRRSN